MNSLVKITADEDGDEIPNAPWCLSVSIGGSPSAFCTMQVYGYGEGSAKFETKSAVRGITCPDCIAKIKEIKAVRL